MEYENFVLFSLWILGLNLAKQIYYISVDLLKDGHISRMQSTITLNF